MKDFLTEIYRQLQLRRSTMDCLEKAESILVIRSAAMQIFEKLISDIRKKNPDIFLYVITHERDKSTVEKVCARNYEVILYKGSTNYDSQFMTEQLDYLKKCKIDNYLYMINNKYGVGNENVEEILLQLTDQNINVADASGKLFVIDNPQLHMTNLKIFSLISDWLWACMDNNQESCV